VCPTGIDRIVDLCRPVEVARAAEGAHTIHHELAIKLNRPRDVAAVLVAGDRRPFLALRVGPHWWLRTLSFPAAELIQV
jgi:hypothetical protein